MKLFRYLFIGILIGGGLWVYHHQDSLPESVRPTALMRQFTTSPPLAAARSGPSAGRHILYYTPETNPERVDVPLIENIQATGHIDAAFYSFTDKPTAEAMLAAANRGVKIRIYRDEGQFEQEKSRNAYMTTMFAGNQNVQIRVKGSSALMHLKAWSTEGLLRDGSSNVSAAAKHQDNSITLSSNSEEIKAFEKKFNDMWNRSNNVVIQ